ncbi:uncharacterized protein [Pseudorasbora parva]|uniref:uncharacterized protein n=1 Tax=Pseudorasbora parva TaxID=51549 RepID=UPI00351DCE23
MFVLGVLTCIVLRALSAQAKVDEVDFSCKEFFYKNKEPGGMDQNAKKICQYTAKKICYYASLYSIQHKIPIYSAYIFNPKCTSDSGRTSFWHLEPQISKPTDEIIYMVRESQKNKNDYKGYQATSDDYSNTGFDIGHLYPNSFQCGDGRMATNTLTNTAPMDPCFNRVYWKQWEETLKNLLIQHLGIDKGSATAYIVTGTVPVKAHRIPQKEISQESERVTVPDHIWTAVCYHHHTDDAESFSFGYIGKNRPEGGISMQSVEKLNEKLSELYTQLSGNTQTVKLFEGDCFSDNNKLSKIQEKFKKLLNLPGNEGVQMSPDVKNVLGAVKRTMDSDNIPSTSNVKISKMSAQLSFTNIKDYGAVAEVLKMLEGCTCLITKRAVSKGSDVVECLLVPEQKTAADGSQCSGISESSSTCQCVIGSKSKPCCSSSCLYQNKLKGYRCLSGQNLIPCSPQYSLITVKGEKCKDDHPCGTYDKDYYWCNTISGGLGYCSPPLFNSKAVNGKNCRVDSACAKYGESQPWCYTDDGIKNKCCLSDDCFSAENGLTCRPDHPCGKYGKAYLWCYTDRRNTEAKCCTGCGK